MLSLLIAGDNSTASSITTRAQLPLLLNQLVVTTTYSIDQAVETDTAQNLTVFIGAALIQIDQAVETDTAQNLTVVNPPGVVTLSITQAVETDTAWDLTVATSPPGAYPSSATYPGSTLYPWSGAYYQIDQAVETDTAFDITPLLTRLFPVTARTGITLEPASADPETLTPVTPT